MMKMTEMLLRDAAAVRALAEAWLWDFGTVDDAATEVLEDVGSRCAVVDLGGAPGGLISSLAEMLDESALPGPATRAVLRRYEPGDYTPAHRFRDEAAGTGTGWTVLCALDDSDLDALTHWDGERFTRTFDRCGVALRLQPEWWCWTSPVRGGVRHTLAIGGDQLWTN